MANYNKSFNFRNGVQVDQDNFLVDSLGRVGIGTTIARTDLDVYGNAAFNGRLDTIDSISSGIATFSGTVKVGTGITMYAESGIISATYYGDGSNLLGLPTSQWVDVDPLSAYSSIYATKGNVGIATTNPAFTLQIGGNPSNTNGLGISSEGNVRTSGIITAKSFVGSGAGVTSINASNISSGTFSANLFSNINSSGIATIGTLGVTGTSTARNLSVSGIATIGFATFRDVHVSGAATIATLDVTTATISNLTVTQNISFQTFQVTDLEVSSNTNLIGITTIGTLGVTGTSTARNLQVTGVTTVGFITATNLYVSGIATIGTAKGDYLNVGIGTITSFASSYSQIGISTATTFKSTDIQATGVTTSPKIFSGNVQISNTANTIDSSSGDLKLDAFTKKVSIENDLYVTRNTILSGIATVTTGLVPNAEGGAYLGQSTNAFSEAYIDGVRIGVGGTTTIDTRGGDLVLNASTNKVNVLNDLYVTRGTYLVGIATVALGLVPDVDGGAYLGQSTNAFSEAYIDGVRIGVGGTTTIDTRGGDLELNSSTQKVNVLNDLYVTRNTILSGIATVTTGLVPNAEGGAYLGQSTNAFSEAYIDGVRIGVGGTTTIDTRGGDLVLNASTNKVNVLNDLYVTRGTYLVGIATVALGLVPDVDGGAYLGTSSNAFSEAYIDGVQIGVGESTIIDTRGGDLKLDAFTKKVSIENDLYVTRGTYLSGIATVALGLVPDVDGGAYIGTSGNAFSEAYIDGVRIGVGGTTTIDTRGGDLKLDASTNKVNVLNDLYVTRGTYLVGIATVALGLVPNTDTGAYLGQSTKAFSEAYIDGVRIGVGGTTTIDTRGGDLKLDASTNKVNVVKDLEVTRNTYLTGIATVQLGLVPNTDTGAYLGTSSKAFSEAYIDEIVIGVTGNTVTTRTGDLKLDAFANKVSIENDLYVVRNTYLTGIATVTLGLVPNTDTGAYLGTSSKAFSEAYIDGIRMGVGGTTTIDTRGGDLKLDAFTKKVNVVNDLEVTRNTYLTGIATVALGLVPNTDTGAYLGTSSKAFSEAYIDGVQIGVGGTTTIDTRGGDLELNASTDKVKIANDLYVTRGTYLAGIATVALGLVPNTDTGAYLGQSTKAFSEAYIDGVRIGVGGTTTIDTRGGDLELTAAATQKVNVLSDLKVDLNTYLVGITTIQTGLVPNTDTGAYLGQSTKAFSEAYIDEVRIGVGGTTTIDTRGGDLKLTAAATQKVNVLSDLKVDLNTYLVGITTIQTGLVPDADVDAYLGQSNKAFEKAYISGVQIGVGGTTTIDTRGGDLILDSSTDNVKINNNLLLPEKLYVGSNYNTLYVDGQNNKVGIGTSAPSKDFEFKRQGEAEFAIISNTNSAKLTVSSGNTSAYFKINPTTYELGIINDYPANVSSYIHAGAAGINTGNFNWVYGQNNNILMSLTYGGKLGIGKTDPINTFHVVGTSTITSNSYVGNNLYVANNLYFNSLQGTVDANTNVTSGVSTFSTLYMYGGQNILGIGTNNAGSYKFKIQDGLDAYLGTKSVLGVENSDDTNYFAANPGVGTSYLKVLGSLYARTLYTGTLSPASISLGTLSVLNVGTGVTISSGIVTAVNGFSSGVGGPVQITLVDNNLYFTVVGVGSTSIQLF